MLPFFLLGGAPPVCLSKASYFRTYVLAFFSLDEGAVEITVSTKDDKAARDPPLLFVEITTGQ